MTAQELAALVGGARVGPDRSFFKVAPVERAGPDDLAFTMGPVPDTCAAGVILATDPLPGRTVVVVQDPRLAFSRVLAQFFPEVHEPGVHPGAFVHPTARLGARVVIYPGAVVGADCAVGDDTILFPNVVLYPGTEVGRRCRIHAGAVLGADGFAYQPSQDGLVKVPQVGRLRVEDDVEIGANTCIDRAFLEETLVGAGSKIDNLVQIGHNSRLGRCVVLVAQSGLGGSVKLGDGVLLAGQAGVADHVTIGAGAVVGAQAGVNSDLPGGERYLGSPALPAVQARRIFALWRRLPDLWRAFAGRGQDEVD